MFQPCRRTDRNVAAGQSNIVVCSIATKLEVRECAETTSLDVRDDWKQELRMSKLTAFSWDVERRYVEEG